jgi:Amt family ammonium transporter
MIEWYGTKNDAFSVTGAIYGNTHQILLQIYGAAFIIAINVVGTFILLKLIGLVVSLRMDEETLAIGDDAIHGEEAYAIFGDGQKIPVMGD